jgi:prepilin-type N-terminal cleavage/methylation domain-containing protein
MNGAYIKQRTQTSRHAGFTLVEVIVVSAVSTVLMLVITNLILDFYRYNDYTIAQTNELEQARRGLTIMIRDLREMTFADNGQFPLQYTGSTSIAFFSDIDRDDSVELVTYELSSTTLSKYIYDAVGATYSTTTPDESIVLSEYVQNGLEGNPIFRYYDLNGDEATSTTAIADLRFINVDVTVNVDPIRNPGQYTLRSSAALRNIIETY